MGGAPDPFVVIVVNDQPLSQSVTFDDTFSVNFNGVEGASVEADLVAGSTVMVAMGDEDVSDDDLVMACQASPFVAANVGSALRCDAGDGYIEFTVTAR
jgi:hypothetical protein